MHCEDYSGASRCNAVPCWSLTRRDARSHFRYLGATNRSRPGAPWSTTLLPAGNKSFPGRSRLVGSRGTIGNRPLSGLALIADERPSIARYVHMSRLMDAVFSIADHHALDIHGRVERWALDEASARSWSGFTAKIAFAGEF